MIIVWDTELGGKEVSADYGGGVLRWLQDEESDPFGQQGWVEGRIVDRKRCRGRYFGWYCGLRHEIRAEHKVAKGKELPAHWQGRVCNRASSRRRSREYGRQKKDLCD